jgi:hypothetical protein
MLHYPLWSPRPTHLLLQLKLTKPPGSLRGSNTSANRFRISYRSPMTSTSKRHDQHRVPHKFQVGNKVWLHLQKECLTGPHQKLLPLHYGSYTITKVVGDNSFELNIPPFLGLHPMFNVDILRPYFPPLLDTSEIAEQLTPIELNPTAYNRNPVIILWTNRSRALCQQRIQLYRVVKAGQLLHQGKWLTWGQIQQKFPHLMGELNAMETISS